MGTPYYPTPASDIWWSLLETCSNLFTSDPTGADIWWLLKHVWSEQMGGTHPTGMLPCVLKVNVHIWYQQKENMVHKKFTADNFFFP